MHPWDFKSASKFSWAHMKDRQCEKAMQTETRINFKAILRCFRSMERIFSMEDQ